MSSRCAAVAVIMLACAVAFAKANAEPMLTISCDKPEGFNIEYGTTLMQRFEASQKKQPEPQPALSGPNKDGYVGKPTFVIDSNRNVTVIWAELPEDVELRKRAKELNLPQMPPPPAKEATIVWFSSEQISAIQVDASSVMTYSFFPTLGTAFISQQYVELGSKTAIEMATFAHCEFSWLNPNNGPGKNRQ